MVHLNVTAFVEAWTALYTHFDAVGYIPPDYVVYPPFSPPLPAPQDSLNVHPLVLDLLSRIPHPASYDISGAFEILPRTRGLPYTENDTLQLSQDPLTYYYDVAPEEGENFLWKLKPEEVLMTTQLPNGLSLVLDVSTGTIREYSTTEFPPGKSEQYLIPENPVNARNWPELPAVETIWSYVHKFESLEWIAFKGNTECGIIELYDGEHAELKRTMIEDYGWPHAFRRDVWIKERREVLRNIRGSLPRYNTHLDMQCFHSLLDQGYTIHDLDDSLLLPCRVPNELPGVVAVDMEGETTREAPTQYSPPNQVVLQ